DDYTHRTGRTARMGRKGIALTLYTKQDLHKLKTVINTNNIQPVWQGKEPDLKHISHKHKSRRRPSRNFRPRRNK
ncbi:MAG: hypothetical protein RQ760_01505, partial [Sedimentisphaerales bacterium]|nr:hypothetical protein [Sedimentisphaerales bacterium]